ncbi:hypothetical protein DFH94DRAFT_640946, partial [Russula ochroleuca]
VKAESTKDLLLIFSDHITVKFKKKNDIYKTVVGRWCTVCREDKDLVKRGGVQKAFLKGSNSSCCQHLQKHWEIYQKRCKDAKIKVYHWAIP